MKRYLIAALRQCIGKMARDFTSEVYDLKNIKGPKWIKPSLKEMHEELSSEESQAYDYLTQSGKDELNSVFKTGQVITLSPDVISDFFINAAEGDFEVPDNWLDPNGQREQRYNPEHHKDLIPDMISGGTVTMPVAYTYDEEDYHLVSGRHRMNYAYQLGIPVKVYIPDDLGELMHEWARSE